MSYSVRAIVLLHSIDPERIFSTEPSEQWDNGAFDMKFQFHLKNGKTHQFTLPDNAEAHRAILWVSKEKREDEKPRFIIIPDDVESVEVIEDRARPSPPPTLGAASPTIYCVYCGAENRFEDNFCQKCGKKLVKSGGY